MKSLTLFRKIGIVPILLVVFALAFHQVSDLDVWLNLASGQWMLAHGRILDHDIFSYPYQGAPWVNHQWLFQIGTALVYMVGGVHGVVMGRVALLLGVVALLWRLCRKDIGGSPLILSFVLLVGLLAMNGRIVERAHLLSLVFTVLTLWAMERWTSTQNARWIFFLVPLQVLWANCHAGFVMGPVLCLTGWVGHAWNRLRNWQSPLRPAVVGVGVGALLGLVSLINPFGPRVFSFIYQQWSSELVRAVIAEWRPPFEPGFYARSWELWFGAWYLSLVLCASFALRTGWDAKRLLWAVMGAVLFVSARRYADTMVVLAAPWVVDNLSRLFSGGLRERIRLRVLGYLGFVLLALGSFWWIGTNRYWIADADDKRLGWGVSRGAYPEEAIRFIEENRLKGNLFHDYNTGSYLTWRLNGRYPVFIDGRHFVYSESFLRDYFAIMEGKKSFEEMAQRYDVSTVLLLQGGQGLPLKEHLLEHADWRLVYLDAKAIVFAEK